MKISERGCDHWSSPLCRVRNIQNSSAIALSDVSLQYWFQGPDASLSGGVESAPWDYFEGRCEWATTGCENVTLGISQGYADVPGARFALNVTFNSQAGLLLPSGDSSVPAFFLGSGVDVQDVLLTVTTKAGVAELNSTQDYSFLDTPVLTQPLNDTNTTTAAIVPRMALANTKIPAYLQGSLVWGVLPTAGSEAPATEPGMPEQGSLPEGILCESVRNGTQQSCTLQAMYCCTSPDPSAPGVSPTIPAQWPPQLLVPASPGVEGGASGPAQESPSSPIVLLPPLPPPSPPAETTGQQSSTGGGGSMAWVAGVAVGVIALLVAGGVGFIVYRCRRRRRRTNQDRQMKGGRGDAKLGPGGIGGGYANGKLESGDPQHPNTQNGYRVSFCLVATT